MEEVAIQGQDRGRKQEQGGCPCGSDSATPALRSALCKLCIQHFRRPSSSQSPFCGHRVPCMCVWLWQERKPEWRLLSSVYNYALAHDHPVVCMQMQTLYTRMHMSDCRTLKLYRSAELRCQAFATYSGQRRAVTSERRSIDRCNLILSLPSRLTLMTNHASLHNAGHPSHHLTKIPEQSNSIDIVIVRRPSYLFFTF